jgi:Predicted membrane protein
LSATAMPIIFFGTQIAAAPFYPGYSFSQQSISMLGTSFSERPWIFNAGETLTGVTALAAALGLFQVFLRKTNFLVSCLIGFAVACIGIMAVKAGMFPMPDPHHNSWELLQNFIIVTPHLMLLGLWKQGHNLGLRTYLLLSIALLVLLVPLSSRLGPGTLQRLISAGTLVPVGVVGFSFWRELRRKTPDKSG